MTSRRSLSSHGYRSVAVDLLRRAMAEPAPYVRASCVAAAARLLARAEQASEAAVGCRDQPDAARADPS